MEQHRPKASDHSLQHLLRTITFWIAGVYVAVWVFQRNHNFLFLLLIAWLMAIAMDPMIRWLGARGIRRGGATGIVMLTLVVLGALFVAAFGGVLLSQATALVQQAPNIVSAVVSWLNTTFHFTLDPTKVTSILHITPAQIAAWAGSFAGGFFGLLNLLVGGLFQLLTMLLFAYYIAAEGPTMRRVIGSWLSPHAQKIFVTTWDIAVAKTGGFVVSRLLLATISAVVHSTAFAVIGVHYWLPLGILTGLTGQFIPTVGAYLGALVPMLVSLYQNPMDAVYIAIFASVYQQIENYLLAPRVSKRTMDIHPAVAFAAVIVFSNLFGAMGALISIPLAAALVSVVDTYGHRYELIPELEH